MRLFGKDLERDVLIVAEIGVNHEGDLARAVKLLRAAHQAGADAVKFQSYTPARFVSSTDGARMARIKRFCLDEQAHEQLARYAQDIGAHVFSAAITEDVVPLLSRLFAVIKVASGDLNFEPIVRTAARSGKPIILSTGNSTIDEIEQALAWCEAEMVSVPLSERVAILHCVSAYPTPLEQVNLLAIPFLQERFGLCTGYSNHILDGDIPVAAVALGAKIIEVHVTDRREGQAFRDHAISFEPQELAVLVRRIRSVEAARGRYAKTLQPAELEIRPSMRKGIVAARDLDPDTLLSRDDLMYARPATEFSAAELPRLIGRRLKVGLRCGELIPRNGLVE